MSQSAISKILGLSALTKAFSGQNRRVRDLEERLQELRSGHQDQVDRLRASLDDAEGQIRTLTERLATVSAERDAYRKPYERWLGYGAPSYEGDFLLTWNKSVGFMGDDRFLRAYGRGMNSGHVIGRPTGSDADIHIEWRIAVCCWAGAHAARLPGDFVECGTNTGIMSLAICDYISFNDTGKRFFLFDTFEGIPEEQINPTEASLGRGDENSMYPECFELTRRNFSPFPKAQLVRGKVPDTLSDVDIESVCYLCIDMNIKEPERAALAHFWPKLVPGAVVIFDDYGWLAYREQKLAHDEFARSVGAEILELPTGQGLMIKPPR
jgi:hypothetical protein